LPDRMRCCQLNAMGGYPGERRRPRPDAACRPSPSAMDHRRLWEAIFWVAAVWAKKFRC
jgi:hypothetical protein